MARCAFSIVATSMWAGSVGKHDLFEQPTELSAKTVGFRHGGFVERPDNGKRQVDIRR